MELVTLFNNNENKERVFSKLESLFQEHSNLMKKIDELSDSLDTYNRVLSYFFDGNSSTQSILKKEVAVKVLDAEMWDKAIRFTNILDVMSAKERSEWSENIRTRNTPSFTKETVTSTIESLLISSNDFLARRVDGIFNNLSGTHVTNEPNGFRERMIFNLVPYGSISFHMVEVINDFRSVIHQLLGRKPERFETYVSLTLIQNQDKYGEWLDFDGGAFKLKLFKKGTAHLEVSQSIAMQLNQILAYLHPHALASTTNKKQKEFKKVTPNSNFLKSETIDGIYRLLSNSRKKRTFYVEKKPNPELFDILKSLGGTYFNGQFSFSYDVHEVFEEILRMGTFPDKKTHQFYPTEESLADLAVSHLHIFHSDLNTFLEPSAGIGNLAEKIRSNCGRHDKIKCIEISKINTKVLKSKNFDVECMDFLDYPTTNKFSRILMNPPFEKGQAKNHLEKALMHLDEDGRLVAILPSSMKDYSNDSFDIKTSEIYENAFLESGTKVSVIILIATPK